MRQILPLFIPLVFAERRLTRDRDEEARKE
jgi:hypothetical protein